MQKTNFNYKSQGRPKFWGVGHPNLNILGCAYTNDTHTGCATDTTYIGSHGQRRVMQFS